MPKPASGVPIIDNADQIHLRFLIDRNYLKAPGRKGKMAWEWNGREVGSASLRTQIQDGSGQLIVSYSFDGGPQTDYLYWLESTPSNLGPGRGRVWYIICPVSGERCRKLYQIDKRFLGRKAYRNIMYQGQTESKSDRNRYLRPAPWPDGKRMTYAGEYTKAYLKHYQQKRKADMALINIARALGMEANWPPK